MASTQNARHIHIPTPQHLQQPQLPGTYFRRKQYASNESTDPTVIVLYGNLDLSADLRFVFTAWPNGSCGNDHISGRGGKSPSYASPLNFGRVVTFDIIQLE
jgi:hypothetical protein